jgi:hypothetical protein
LVLFLTNLVAIQVAASVVLWLCGYNRLASRREPGGRILLRNAASFGILLMLASVLGLQMFQTLNTHRFERKVRVGLLEGLQAEPGGELVDLRFQPTRDTVIVTAEIKSPRPFTPEQVAALEAKLPEPAEKKLELVVHTVLTHRVTIRGDVQGTSAPRERAR